MERHLEEAMSHISFLNPVHPEVNPDVEIKIEWLSCSWKNTNNARNRVRFSFLGLIVVRSDKDLPRRALMIFI